MTSSCGRCGSGVAPLRFPDGTYGCSTCGAPVRPRPALSRVTVRMRVPLPGAAVPENRGSTKTQFHGTSSEAPAAADRQRLPAALTQAYTVLGVLGEGGMGIVYRAVQKSSGRPAALKLTLAGDGRERFLTEGRVLAKLSHPNVVAVLEAGEADDQLYLAMELVEGESLASWLDRRGSLNVSEAIELGQQIAAGLSHAHRQGVLHRDLKPENILIAPGPLAKIADFGLGRALGSGRVTQAGLLLGTPGYMAPELFLGRETSVAADIYSLGAVLYEMLVGEPPHGASDIAGLIARQAAGPPAPPSTLRSGLPSDLDAVVLRCLERDPAARFPDAEEVGAALARRRVGPASAVRPAARSLTVRGAVAGASARSNVAGRRSAWFASGLTVVCLAVAIAARIPSRDGSRKPMVPAARAANPRERPPVTTASRSVAPADLFREAGLVLAGKTGKGFEEWTSAIDGSVLIRIPEGYFVMGAEEDEPDEQPRHRVWLSEFLIGKTEVTVRQYGKFVRSTGYRTVAERRAGKETWKYPLGRSAPESKPGEPVVQVTWEDAMSYCRWARLRLPTEAEWEKAARGVDGAVYSWGSVEPDRTSTPLANVADRRAGARVRPGRFHPGLDDGYEFVAPAGSYPAGATPWGALDMAGNVAEWCEDWYAPDAYDRPGRARDPKGPEDGSVIVQRGGSWRSLSADVRAGARSWSRPHARDAAIGFRVARSMPR